MPLYYRPPDGRPSRLLPGPGDLAALSDGVVRVTGPADSIIRWAPALGLFVARGGSIERK